MELNLELESKVDETGFKYYEDAMANKYLAFNAISYKSGERQKYILTSKLDTIVQLNITKSDVKKRGQLISQGVKNRFLDKKHKDEIKEYLKIEKKYILPAITFVSTQDLFFVPCEGNFITNENSSIGILIINLSQLLECLDGNHRFNACIELYNEEGYDTSNIELSFEILIEPDVEKVKQDFVDINKNAKPTTATINTSFNSRDPLPKLTKKLRNDIPYLNDIIEEFNTSVNKNGKKIYTLNNINNVLIELSGIESQGARAAEKKLNKILNENEEFRKELYITGKKFFESLKFNTDMDGVIKNHSGIQYPKSITELREESVLLTGVGITIVAAKAYTVIEKCKEENLSQIDMALKELMSYDWSRSNPIFTQTNLVSIDRVKNKKSLNTNRGIITATKEFLLKNVEI